MDEDDQSREVKPEPTYKVGYGRPPKEYQFGQRRQPNRTKGGAAEPAACNIAAVLDRPFPVKLNGKRRKIHPHEAILHGLFKRS